MLKIENDKSLKRYNTFAVNAVASKFCNIESANDLLELINSNILSDVKYFIIGSGSNVLFVDDFNGLIIASKIPGIKIIEKNSDYAIVEAGAGVNWHSFVKFCIDNKLYGLENLSKIPGTVAAAAVQNIGAYGAEQKDRFHSLSAYNLSNSEITEFTNLDCKFDYRFSIFKSEFKNQFFISNVRYKLSLTPTINIDYKDILQRIEKDNIINPSAEYIFNTVASIREEKLPNPDEFGNAGSFFKNPIISEQHFNHLLALYPNIVAYKTNEGRKIPAAWLIENSGLKGYRKDDAAVSPKHSLVLINYGKANGRNILELSEFIINTIYEKYSILLEPEVIII